MIPTLTNKARFLGNGISKVFSFYFRVLNVAHIKVFKLDIEGNINELVQGVEYSVTLNTNDGYITTAGALLVDEVLIILRDVPLTQETDYQNQGSFFAETHEESFDKLTAITQQIKELTERAVRFPITDINDTTIPTKEKRKDTILGFDEVGNFKALPGVVETLRIATEAASVASNALTQLQDVNAQCAFIANIYDSFISYSEALSKFMEQGNVFRPEDNIASFGLSSSDNSTVSGSGGNNATGLNLAFVQNYGLRFEPQSSFFIPSASSIDDLVKGVAIWTMPLVMPSYIVNKSYILYKTNWSLYIDVYGAVHFEYNFSSVKGYWKTASVLKKNYFYHIGIKYDCSNSSNVPKIFIDGQDTIIYTQSSPVGVALSDAGFNLYLGCDAGNSFRFNGYFRDLRIYTSSVVNNVIIQAHSETEQDIQAIQTQNIVAWFNANDLVQPNGAPVTMWTAKNNASIFMTPEFPLHPPIMLNNINNNNNAVKFSHEYGINSGMILHGLPETGTGIVNNYAMTIYVVVKCQTPCLPANSVVPNVPKIGGYVLASSNSEESTNSIVGYLNRGVMFSGRDSIFIGGQHANDTDITAGAWNGNDTGTTFIQHNVWHLLTLKQPSLYGKYIYINNDLFFSRDGIDFQTALSFYTGAVNRVGENFNGEISDIIIYKEAHTDAVRLNTGKKLMTKFNPTASLPYVSPGIYRYQNTMNTISLFKADNGVELYNTNLVKSWRNSAIGDYADRQFLTIRDVSDNPLYAPTYLPTGCNGKPCIKFTSGSSFLYMDGYNYGETYYDGVFYFVIRYVTTTGAKPWLGVGDVEGDKFFTFTFGNKASIKTNGNNYGVANYAYPYGAGTNWHIEAYTCYTNSLGTAYFNGVAKGVASYSVLIGDNGTRFLMGDIRGSAGNLIYGGAAVEIAEIIYTPGQANALYLEGMHDYLNKKYNIY